jgi:hypothetical protein
MSMVTPKQHFTTGGTGYDHSWFEFQPLFARKPLQWPDGAPIALWITVPIEFFPLDGAYQPVRPLGAMERPYPDFYGFSQRDYGNRIGIYRVMRALDRFKLRATAMINAEAAVRNPRLIQELMARDWDIMASGIDMSRVLHAGLERDAEQVLISESVSKIEAVVGRKVTGWHSPAHSQSMNTLELLAAQGLDHVADWTNDDLPYLVTTPAGMLTALPLKYEWSDRKILMQDNASMESYQDQVLAGLRWLEQEAATHGGHVLPLSVTPWILGCPYYIAALKAVLQAIMRSGSVRAMVAIELVQAIRTQRN